MAPSRVGVATTDLSAPSGLGNLVCAKPTGVVEGDLLIAQVYRRGACTPPAGWTLLAEQQSPAGWVDVDGVYTKVATAAEPADYTWVIDGTDRKAVAIAAFRDAEVKGTATNTGTNVTSHQGPAATPTEAVTDGVLLHFCTCAYANTSTTANWTTTSTKLWGTQGVHRVHSSEQTGITTSTAVSPANVDHSVGTNHLFAGITVILGTPPPPTYSDEVLADAPLAYYRLGEASGTAMVDASGNARDGTYYGTPALGAAGLLADGTDTAVDFDGVDDRGQVTSATWMDATNVTFEALVNLDTIPASGVAPILYRLNFFTSNMDQRLGFALNVTSAGKVRFDGPDDSNNLTGTTTLVTGTTYHIAGTYDGATARLYVNGVQEASAATTGSATQVRNLLVGAREANSDGTTFQYADGRIDEAAFYGTALSATRIKAHYDAAVAAGGGGGGGGVSAQLAMSADAHLTLPIRVSLALSADAAATFNARVLTPDRFVDRADWLSGDVVSADVDLSQATLDSGESAPSGVTKTWWLEFTEGDNGGRRRLTITGAAATGTLRVYTSTSETPTLGGLTLLVTGPDVQFDTNPSQTYYVQVGLLTGDGLLTVQNRLVDVDPGSDFNNPVEENGDLGGSDVVTEHGTVGWMTWTAPDPAQKMTFTVYSDAASFTVTVYTGATEATLTSVVSGTGTDTVPASLTFTPVAGTVYRVKMESTVNAWYSVAWYPQPSPVEPEEPVRHLRVEVYQPDGVTKISEVPRRFGVRFQEKLNTPGYGEIQVPVIDPLLEAYPDLFQFGNIVKFVMGNRTPSGFVIREKETTLVDTGEHARWVRRVAGPTLLWLLNDWTVRHDGPTRDDSLDERSYSWASRPAEWYNPDDWNDPIADAPLDDPPGGNLSPRTAKENRAKWKFPKKWPDPTAMWTFAVGRQEAATYYGTTVPAKKPGWQKHRYYRKNFRVEGSRTLVRVHATADENFQVYLDGEEILAEENSEFGYKSFVFVDLVLAKGMHTIAVHTINGAWGVKNRDQNDSFLLSVMKVDKDGSMSDVLVNSNRKWKAWIGSRPPGWNRAQVLLNAVREARERKVHSADRYSFGFDKTNDADGRPWVDRFNKTVQIGTGGADLQAQLSEGHGFDVHLRPADMKLLAWRMRGRDKSASVALEPGLNLISWKVTETDEIANDFLVRYDGGWVTSRAPHSIKKWDRREAYVELGTVRDDVSAKELMRRIIRGSERHRVRNGTPQVLRKPTGQPEGGMIAVPGAWPFLDWNVGDHVMVPNENGRLVRQRCLALTCIEDEAGELSFDPEFDVMDGPVPSFQAAARPDDEIAGPAPAYGG